MLVFFDKEREGVKHVVPSAGWLINVSRNGADAAPAAMSRLRTFLVASMTLAADSGRMS
jgi:hypothetical protein